MLRLKIRNERSRTYKYAQEDQIICVTIFDPIYEWHQGDVTHVQSADGNVFYIPGGWVCFEWEPIDRDDPFESGALRFL